MKRVFLRAKIHRATVTEANLDYQGSVTIDRNLLEAADIAQYEQVEIYNIDSGSRLTTYAIAGDAGSGVICINGAAAHLAEPGDLVIIACYCQLETNEIAGHAPRQVHVDRKNRQIDPSADVATLGADR